jgi:hypothetical protein
MKRSTENALGPANGATKVPAITERSGGNARFAYDEFFKATINNEHTRRAYGRIVGRLLAWCEGNDIELRQIPLGMAGDYIGQLEGSAPTKNQALAALRHFFDAMVTRHVVPAQFVRIGPRHQAQRDRGQDGGDFNRTGAQTFPFESTPAPLSACAIALSSAFSPTPARGLERWRSSGFPTIAI